jgi:acetyltransferase-like isoleucine patch superfamily enzyme
MPWLYDIEKHKMFSKERQKQWQEKLMQLETIEIKGEDTYISDENVHIFAERGRKVVIENNCRIASGCFIHGPCVLEENVGLNQSVHMDGGSGKGIHIGCDTRIGPSTSIFAFNHSFDDLTTPVRLQKVKSKGVTIGRDVWIGANVSIVDGVTIGSHAVVGIASVVTKDIPEYEIWAGNPAKKIGKRGD